MVDGTIFVELQLAVPKILVKGTQFFIKCEFIRLLSSDLKSIDGNEVLPVKQPRPGSQLKGFQ